MLSLRSFVAQFLALRAVADDEKLEAPFALEVLGGVRDETHAVGQSEIARVRGDELAVAFAIRRLDGRRDDVEAVLHDDDLRRVDAARDDVVAARVRHRHDGGRSLVERVRDAADDALDARTAFPLAEPHRDLGVDVADVDDERNAPQSRRRECG